MAFEIPSDLKLYVAEVFDDMITEFGKTCRLYYEPTFTECENCYYDTQMKRSSGRYKPGGPHQFTYGVCPVCGGTGGQFTENTENIVLVLNKDPRKFRFVNNIRIPDIDMQTRGRLIDLPKIQKALYMISQISLEPYLEEKFVLTGTPTDIHNITQNKFFIANWKYSQ